MDSDKQSATLSDPYGIMQEVISLRQKVEALTKLNNDLTLKVEMVTAKPKNEQTQTM
jgi:hypothetical protein